ncbi:hypothetical protein DFQ27_003387 [Actinomortierella ambigua]|uniref:Uncharacterized protein n=1 Tax=Actinomortierella ambigua TaxID=1343610 RepID=A0A9P6QN00_9FUNG|nr:hypothetical protein DFQ26_004671 [Actinomortierella ambigua]KAG0269475.1 hypothetical protein DFQ27_003387 [Actinomortierella ambigua]
MSQQRTRNGDTAVLDGDNEIDPATDTMAAASQEVDFQQPGRVNIPQRMGPGRKVLPDPVPNNDETEHGRTAGLTGL